VDGTDLSPLWQPGAEQRLLNSTLGAPFTVSFSEYPRCAPLNAAWTPEPGHATPQSCVNTKRSNFTVMGYSVRRANRLLACVHGQLYSAATCRARSTQRFLLSRLTSSPRI